MIESRLRHLMADKKINSRSELQRMTGLSRTPLDRLYRGEAIDGVPLGIIYRICKAMGCELKDLIKFNVEREA